MRDAEEGKSQPRSQGLSQRDPGNEVGQVLLVLTLVTSTVHFGADVRPRRAWSLPRPQEWFNLMLNAPIYNYDPYWREHLTSECLDEHFGS